MKMKTKRGDGGREGEKEGERGDSAQLIRPGSMVAGMMRLFWCNWA